MASGEGSIISFYINNGVEFIFRESIETSEMNIIQPGVNNDFSIVTYGWANQIFNVYKKNNNNSY